MLHAMSVRFAAAAGADWRDACEPDREGKRWGFPLAGRWDAEGRRREDPSHFTLTCTSGAQAKCVRYGYKPWKKAPDGSDTMAALYEACTHMARADYCGDGVPSTRDGTTIDIYDQHGVQQPATGPEFRFEAGWTPAGAVCVHHPRIPANLTLDALEKRCPRLSGKLGASCSEEKAKELGAILFNRSKLDPGPAAAPGD
jgi:hypothetical protein